MVIGEIRKSVEHLLRCPEGKIQCIFYISGIVLFFFNLSWMGSYCVYLWVLQFLQISRNITTNETINWRHYSYLQDEVVGGEQSQL